jgi:hypothetical protein
MNSSDRVNWAHRQTDRDLIRFALHRDNINLEGHECYAVMMVLACRLGDALDRSDFEASALDFDPDDRPVVAEACTDSPTRHVQCGEGPYPLPVAEAVQAVPRQSTFAETYSRIDRQLSRARNWLHRPAGQEEMIEHAAAFNVPEEMP